MLGIITSPVEEVEGQLYPVAGSRRYFYSGFYDRTQNHGTITGSGPGFERAIERFQERQKRLGEIGVWRSGDNGRMNVSRGETRDIDYDIVEWM